MRKTSTPVHKRILQRTTIPNDVNECWEWQGPVNNAGYGMIKGDKEHEDPKMMTVHRAIARYYCFPIEGVEVQHTCLNKKCVNPKHLTTGTAQSRCDRIMEKYGRNFQKPKDPYKKCQHCGKTTHIVWFSRKHDDCYPGMLNKFVKKKV